jgi:hypothetical protein
MNSFNSFVAAETDYRRVMAERLSHPQDGALAQQPKAERAPHSAVERPKAAGKLRSTSSTLVSAFVSLPAGGFVFAMAMSSTKSHGQTLAERAGAVDCFAAASPEHREYWFEPTLRGRLFCFLVQDRLRASDVLHRDWDWSAWL